MAKKKPTKKSNKWITLYKPANVGVLNMLEEAHKAMGVENADGSKISLNKFVLLSAVRDVSRTIAMAEAQHEESLRDVKEGALPDVGALAEDETTVEETVQTPTPEEGNDVP